MWLYRFESCRQVSVDANLSHHRVNQFIFCHIHNFFASNAIYIDYEL